MKGMSCKGLILGLVPHEQSWVIVSIKTLELVGRTALGACFAFSGK